MTSPVILAVVVILTVAAFTVGVITGRRAERAAVVQWLRYGIRGRNMPPTSLPLADEIEHGQHFLWGTDD